MALIYLVHAPCSESVEQMKAVREVLLAQKPHVKVYNSDGILERMLSGDTAIHMNWNGYALRARDEKPSIRYAYPKEGVLTWMDNLTVAKGANNQENAIKFLEFFMRPENAAIQSNFARYANGIAGSEEFMDDSLKSSPEIQTPTEVETVFAPSCPEQSIRLQDKVWTSLKQ
jgi:spermidine/putrescine transport system substrate-binding protein